MPIKPHQPPNLRLGRGGAASGLSHAYGDTLSTLSTTNAVNGWKRVARISSSLTPIDLSELGDFVLNDVPVNIATAYGSVSSLEQNLQGLQFDLDVNSFLLFSVRAQDLVPNYQLGQRLRAILKFKTGNLPDLVTAGDTSGAYVGYGIITRIGVAGNQYQGGDLSRVFFGGISPAFTATPGVPITDGDQVIAMQGSHPGWQAFFQSECDQDTPSWSSLTPAAGICTVEGAALLPDGAGTGFDAATDNVMFAMQTGEDAGMSGIIEYLDIYWLDDGESI